MTTIAQLQKSLLTAHLNEFLKVENKISPFKQKYVYNENSF